MNTFKRFLAGLALTGLSYFGVTNAATAAETVCLDNNNLICIQETYDATQSALKNTDISRYTITNNTEDTVYGFAVTNTIFGGNAYTDPNQSVTGWEGKTIEADKWDNNRSAFIFNNSVVRQNWITGKKGTNGFTELGKFIDLFGETTDESGNPIYANIYWNSGIQNVLSTGVTLNHFYFYGRPESKFVAFDYQGQIIQSSLTTPTDFNVAAVPEPSETIMLVFGMAFILLARKKHLATNCPSKFNR